MSPGRRLHAVLLQALDELRRKGKGGTVEYRLLDGAKRKLGQGFVVELDAETLCDIGHIVQRTLAMIARWTTKIEWDDALAAALAAALREVGCD